MDTFYFFFFLNFVFVLLLLFYCCWCFGIVSAAAKWKNMGACKPRARDVRITKWNTKHRAKQKKWECAKGNEHGGRKKTEKGAQEIVKIFKCAVVNMSEKRQTRKTLHI